MSAGTETETGRARPALVAVVAMGRNRVIGADGGMPWSIPSDLRRYRRLTMGKPMIMGRRTLEAIGRVLDGRDTVVLTRQASLPFEGAHCVDTVERAIETAQRLAKARGSDEIVIAGGAQIYSLFLDRLDRIALTEIDAEPEGDASFPLIDGGEWETLTREAAEQGEKDSAPHSFRLLARRSGCA